MKIAIISDTHDNLANLKKALSWINKEKINTLLHCGDVCSPVALKELMDNFSGKVHLVFGNVDGDQFRMTQLIQEYPSRLKVWGELGEIRIDNKNISFCHFPEFARALASTGKYDLVFHGHTHKPWEEKISNSKVVNPGELAGMFNKATFAVYDAKDDKLELKILEKL